MNSDMTKYCYQHFENAYNIGWNVNFDSTVESKETFDSIFIEKLTLYCENPLNSDLNGVCRETEIDGKKYVKGFGEIRIIDLKKKIRYAAPNVIIDDILNGKYIPPIEFVDAVLTGPTFDSEEYQEFYLNYSEKNFWGENEENFEKIAKVLEVAGDLEGFKDYILNNDLINIVVPGGSLLNYAITEGKEKEALWLIENGIDINAFDGLELMTAIKKNNNIIAKLCTDSPSGLLRGSIRPECIPEDSLADKILTKPPLSPENKGTNVSNVGFVSNVSSELLRIPPADTPKTEHTNKTGVDCFIITLFSSE